MAEAYTLKEVNDYIKQVIALNFEDSIWIVAEISQVKEVRGQVYLEFVQKKEQDNSIAAKAQGVIWYKSLMFIKSKLGELTDSILQAGQEIKFKAKIEYHVVYGLKFSVEDLDASYTLGNLELIRQKTIEQLKKNKLLFKNRETTLPPVIQNIAVISSHKAAGLQDFFSHLNNNRYGYAFSTDFYDSSMQGANVERDIVGNLIKIKENKENYDCVVIIRGGGSKMDLSYFDNYNICANVAKFPIPVLTGIGHDIDQNVIEMVAHSPLKTPTAVADFIVEHNMNFEMNILEMEQKIKNLTQLIIQNNSNMVENLYKDLQKNALFNLSNADHYIASLEYKIKSLSSIKIDSEKSRLNEMENILKLSDPFEIIKKGYSITLKENKIVRSIKNIEQGNVVKTILYDGEFESKVIE
ncbi:MAG TPA: exodeoxyribonuclease VII large subunit [Bacteroidetes bacterium]|nr:exodeoxyribonuclease VII large subunit [Bacteroidota bacterium]